MKRTSLTTVWQRRYTRIVLDEMSDVHLRLLHVQFFLSALATGGVLVSLLTPTSTGGRIALFVAFILTQLGTLKDMFEIALITVRAYPQSCAK